MQWTEDFNAGRADKVCDLFARKLRADFRGVPERGYRAQCDLLQRALADPTRRFSYALSIKDIQVWGDTAVVRLDWTLTVRPRQGGSGGAAESVTREPGLDVFRRGPDGRWRIVRYMAFEG
jgi:steroid delta-isomerase